ncbi:hypothetical protein EMQ25_11310 [Arsenicitalea aurantiaca]|uniref:DUF8173 domain-containing protein n=1 Tax=Arsenicitalea aurantiaca TaxID=1783274 RepID=A0A433XBG8_9HYPH|nr:hypothetical protein [Arsenicitalea aurantiaca]RUT31429.1 hypothetical protein EMQ25_11310 [Arsenicitalea aurantiaca]
MSPLPLRAAIAALLILAVAPSGPARAQQDLARLGGDVFVSGTSVTLSTPAARDVFAAGFSTSLATEVEGDLHAAGFDVKVAGAVGADLYAAGFSVTLDAPVASDVTVSAGNLRLEDPAIVGGNARLLAGTARLDAPITGSLRASVGSLELNSIVGGDVDLAVGNVAFGPNARVGGTLSYLASEPIDIPASVVPPERVRFTRIEPNPVLQRIDEHMSDPLRGYWPSLAIILGVFVLTIGFLLLIAAIAHAFAPATTERLRNAAVDHPFRCILLGGLGLSMLIGLVPVSAMTLVGILLIPIVILFIILVWTAGYLLGVHAVSWRVSKAFSLAPTRLAGQLAVLAIGLVVFAVLNFIPVLGWLANLVVIFLGLGAMLQRGATLIIDRPRRADIVV